MNTELRRLSDLLLQNLSHYMPDREAPARIHGDLWSGNHLFDRQGQPWLIDPAACGGHREMDIAMMHLFGGYSSSCFAAYQEIWPLQPEWKERLALWQLYYLLAHVNLHGVSWMSSVLSCLKKLKIQKTK